MIEMIEMIEMIRYNIFVDLAGDKRKLLYVMTLTEPLIFCMTDDLSCSAVSGRKGARSIGVPFRLDLFRGSTSFGGFTYD